MIALSELSKQFKGEKISVKILKPWWDVITDYLVIFLLMVSVLVGGMELTSGSFECLPAVDCPSTSPKNGTLLSGLTKQHNACTAFHSSRKTSGREAVTTVVTEVKNLNHVKYVNSECSKTDIHWFTSYLSLFLFAQASILLILDNFWLKFPSTASIIETFCVLVVECYNSPGTSFGLSKVLWNIPVCDNPTSERVTSNTQNFHEIETLLDEQQDDIPSPALTAPSNHEPSDDVDVVTAVAIKTLYEKIKLFKKHIKLSKRIWRVYLIQTTLQTLLTLVFIIINAVNMSNIQGTIKCNINKVSLPIEYEYFICSHNIVPVFKIALVLFLVVLGGALGVFTFILLWTIPKILKKNSYNFKNKLGDWITTEAVDLKTAEDDMGFLLQLLHAYNKLYVVRFAIFMSEENEKKLKAFILTKEWPITKLERHCEGQNGGKLSLNKLSGIPQTLFDLSRLHTLELTRCGLEEDDFQHFYKLLHLRKLSLVYCGLTKIPEKVLRVIHLEELILKNNSIKSIQDDICHLKSLTTVDISNNELEHIPGNIEALCNLLTLRLSNNPKLEVSAIKNVLACKRLRVLEMPPLTEAQEKELNDEEKKKFATINVQLTITGKGDHVIPYTPKSAPQISEVFQDNPESVYKMDSRPKGIALIINNISFQAHCRLITRDGSQTDVSKLKRLFGQIGFKIATYENCTASKAKKLLEDYAMNKTYEDCDSFVVVVMSHGNTKGIIFIDNEVVNTNKLVEIVDKSPIYKGKPKLFFIQACRGEQLQGHAVQRLPQPYTNDTCKSDASVGDDEPNEETLGIEHADVLLSFSTLPGYVSIRNTKCGSWYVNALVEVFANHAWEEDVLSLLTIVNYHVSRFVTSSGWRQIPAPQSTLRKKLFLLPRYSKFTSYV